jgi:hypothetical protein
MHLSIPQSGHHHQVRLTIRHPNWETTASLDDSHKTFELIAPEGDDIGDIEVFAEFLGVDGQPDPHFSPIPVKEKGPHEEQKPAAGESGESNSSEPGSDCQHPEDSHPTDAGVEGDADAGRVGEAAVEQDADEGDDANEGDEGESTPGQPVKHHKARRPKHA